METIPKGGFTFTGDAYLNHEGENDRPGIAFPSDLLREFGGDPEMWKYPRALVLKQRWPPSWGIVLTFEWRGEPWQSTPMLLEDPAQQTEMIVRYALRRLVEQAVRDVSAREQE